MLGVSLLLALAYWIYEQVTLMQAAETLLQTFRAIAAADPDTFGGLDMSDEAVSMSALDWFPIIARFAVELGAAAWLLTYKDNTALTFAQPMYGVPQMPHMQPAPQWSAPPNSQFGEPR
ncbi:hypothetical protein AWC04_14975 [Mycolicibacterium fallax]|uniref:Uncharacterized protein n=1 Tax=Mycolicibacterium fallax TaxID=1793 RepID=A0A1X1R810_MYCFA|nr:hypothetical protein AWC04_14975 [Mycolicibacterium fallax]